MLRVIQLFGTNKMEQVLKAQSLGVKCTEPREWMNRFNHSRFLAPLADSTWASLCIRDTKEFLSHLLNISESNIYWDSWMAPGKHSWNSRILPWPFVFLFRKKKKTKIGEMPIALDALFLTVDGGLGVGKARAFGGPFWSRRSWKSWAVEYTKNFPLTQFPSQTP